MAQVAKRSASLTVGESWKHICAEVETPIISIIGDGHQPNSRGLYTVYTHYKDSRH